MLRHKLLEFLTSDNRLREIRKLSRGNTRAEICFLIPVHNQESRIAQNILSVLEMASLKFELIIINDKSNDHTKRLLVSFLNSELLTKYKNCVTIRYFQSSIPVYETKCDEFGIKKSTADYVIEIQADMQIREKGFDAKLLKILKKHPSLLGISGRATHNFENLNFNTLKKESNLKFDFPIIISRYLDQIKLNLKSVGKSHPDPDTNSQKMYLEKTIFPRELDFSERGEAGWMGKNIDLIPSDTEIFNKDIEVNYGGVLWCGQTIIRGPIILRKSIYYALGGFDTQSFYLGNDDHDLCARAQSKGYQMGFTPIHFVAPLSHGTERKRKSFKNLVWREIHRFARADKLEQSSLFKLLQLDSGMRQKFNSIRMKS